MMTGAIKVLNKNQTSRKVKSSFDCYNQSTKSRIQIKAANLNSPSTYGPKSQWDQIYFIDFQLDNEFNGGYRIYEIESKLIENVIVNKKKNITFKEMQKTGKRPRFSIYNKIIKPFNIEPRYVDNLFS